MKQAKTSDLFINHGIPAFGNYSGEIKDINLQPFWPNRPWALKKFRTKRWRFVGLFTPKLIIGCAVVHAGYVGTSFAYACELETKRMFEFSAMSPLAEAVHLTDRVDSGEFAFISGSNQIIQLFDAKSGKETLNVDVQAKEGRFIVEAEIDIRKELTTPHQMISPTPKDRFVFTHKAAGMPAKGEVILPSGNFRLEERCAYAGVDHSVGYHDRNWQWRWASLAGRTKEGKRIGLNLVDPILHPNIHENALWVEGERILLSRAHFHFDREKILSPWQIETENGLVSLEFTPIGERSESIDAGVIASRFHQPFGFYNGVIKTTEGEALTVEKMPGVVEDHFARW